MDVKSTLERILDTAKTIYRGSSSHKPLQHRSFSLEPLEKRELLAVTLTVTTDPTDILPEAGGKSTDFVVTVSGLGPTREACVYLWINGSACVDCDYYHSGHTGCFHFTSDGSQRLTITAIDDTEVEGDETLTLCANGQWWGTACGDDGTFPTTSATITIVDDDFLRPCTSMGHSCCDTVGTGESDVVGSAAVENSGSRLTYYSQFASGQQTVVTYSPLQTTNGEADLESVEATLTVFGATNPDTTIWFDGSEAVADTFYAFAFPVDVSGLSTGSYDFTVQLTQHYDNDSTVVSTVEDRHRFINTLDSSMASGWFPFGVSSLIADGSDVLLLRSGLQRFTSDGGCDWTHQSFYDTSDYTLTGDWGGGFTLTAKDGTVDHFGTGGQIISTTDANGNETTYGYESGKLTSIAEPGGLSTTFAYNGGYLASMTKPDGVTSTYTLDGNHRITSITRPDPDGAGPLPAPVTTLTYDATTGLLTSITFPDGGVQSYEYDHALALKKVVRTDGTEDTYSSWYASALVDTSGGVGTTEQNTAELIAKADIEVSSAVAGVTTTRKVDHFGFATNSVDGEGNATVYERNGVGQVLKKTEPDPDGEGPLTATVTEYRYDKQGNMTKIILPDGTTREWEYDEDWAVPTRYTDEAGSITTYAIDANSGNVLTERVIIGEDDTQSAETDDLVTSYTYTDSNDDTVEGLVETVTDPAGTVTEYEYNARGQKTKITYAAGTALEATVEYEYDSTSGVLLAQTDELGRRTEYLYDALNRKTHTILPAANTTGTTIDNSDGSGFSTTGDWTTVGSYIYADTGCSATATWDFTDLDSDKFYEVFITWSEDETNNATDAPFTIYDGTTSSGTALETIDVDQQAAPGGSKLIGSTWHRLGTYELSGSTLSVLLTNDADGRVIADSVRILEHSATQSVYDAGGRMIESIDEAGRVIGYGYDAFESPYLWRHYDAAGQMVATVGPDLRVDSVAYDGRGRTVATYAGKIIDDDTSGAFATTGTWTSASDGGLLDGYQTADSTDQGTATATATWTFENLIVGDQYDVYITWKSVTGSADDAPVAIYQGSTGETATWTGTLDQSTDPTAASGLLPFSDMAFVKLGSSITLSDSTLIVQLANNTGETGEVISADAVYVIRKDPMSQSVYDDGGMLTTTIDALGNETTYTYDDLGRVVAVTQPDPDGAGTNYVAPVSRTYYNQAGQLSGTLGPDGRTDTFGYDGLGRQTTSYTGQTITPSHAGYAEPTGTWSDATAGFLGSSRTATTVTGSATAAATWTLTDLVPGEEYEVYVSWTGDETNGSTDAHFAVYLGSTGGTLVAESDLDQTASPDQGADFPGLGTARFELLTTYELHQDDATTLVIQLSNEGATAGKLVAADAVYVVRKAAMSESVYDFAGRLVATLDAAGNRTDLVYDNLGRQVEVIQPDPDGDGPLTRPRTQYVYDAAGRVIETIQYEGDPLDYDQRGPEFHRQLGDAVDIGAYEGFVGPETGNYVVSTLADESDGDYSSGDLSLREAIYLASQNPGHDLITFDAQLSGTIELSIDQLSINSDLTIQGPGAGTITIDANGTAQTNRRVFSIVGDYTVIISGLTITGGYSTGGSGVYTHMDSDVTLIDLTITGNHGTGTGGGIYTGYADSLVIQGCTITGNSSETGGGGVRAASDRVYIADTTISSNTTGRSVGAGVWASYMTFEMVDCVVSDNVFSDNSGARLGAGMWLDYGTTARISGTVIENNTADSAGEYNATSGAGIGAGVSYAYDGMDIQITDCVIRGNEATETGGGIYALQGNLEIDRTTIEGNTSGYQAGGVYFVNGFLTVSDSLIADNEAAWAGGLLLGGSAESSLTGVTVSGNSASQYAGGIMVGGDQSLDVVNCTITDNTSPLFGGMYVLGNAHVRMDNTIIAGNTATVRPDLHCAGTIDAASSNNLIGIDSGYLGGLTDGVRGNQVGPYGGTPIDPKLSALAYNGGPTRTHALQSDSPAIGAGSDLLSDAYYDARGEGFLRVVGEGIDIGAFEYNTADLVVDELSNPANGLTLAEAIAEANSRPGPDVITFSAGLDLSAAVDVVLSSELSITSDLTILGPGADLLAVSGNESVRVFNVASGVTVRIVGLTLRDGYTTGAGGAVYSAADELTLEECQVLDSVAGASGGGAIYATGRLNLLESTVAGNSAQKGGGLFLDGGSVFLRQATVSDNSATSGDGGGILLEGSASTATILQSTVADNSASGSGGGLRIAAGNVLMHNSIVSDNTATTANPDVYGTLLADSSYNLVGIDSGLSGISDGTAGNQLGTSGSPLDAGLAPLADHGGPVLTQALRVDSPALDAGSDDLAVTRLGRSQSAEYDMLGRTVRLTQVDPDGIGPASAPVTSYAYDAAGQLVAETDPLGNTTSHAYDNLGRKTSSTDAESGVTAYTYDAAGRMASLTDPEQNTTTWTFDPLGRVATETINVNSTDLVRYFQYDAAGNLLRKIDRNGRVIDYAYDALSRQTTETWYDDVTDADAQQNARKTYATTYDAAGRVATIGDGDYDFAYTYSIFGNPTSTTQDLTGLTDDVLFTYTYDVLGRKTGVSAKVGSADDYVNAYSYDNLGRITRITQDGVSGGNAVAEKRVDFAYSDDATRATIARFADLAGTTAVAETEQVFDRLGRVTDIVHERAATEFADYDLTWDAGGRITDFDFTSLVGDDGAGDYTYDDTNQLTGADYDFQPDESYTYDANGNRTNTGYATGDHNRLTSDGTYNYTYDNEGNVTSKTNTSTGESVEYTWDHRNRLVKVTFKDDQGTPTQIIEYAYDHAQRWVRKTLDTNADETIEESRIFVHDANQIVLDFQETGTSAAGNSDLAHRYLFGASVDQLLADETVDDATADDVSWVLSDHLDSVRDLVVFDPSLGTVFVAKHVTYDAYGNVTSDTANGAESLFLYTARPFDVDGGLQNSLNRWYDLSTGRWMSEDPIGYFSGDVNMYRYVVNSPANSIDPSGLVSFDDAVAWIGDVFGVDVSDLFSVAEADWTVDGKFEAHTIKRGYSFSGGKWAKSAWIDAGEESGEIWEGYRTKTAGEKCLRQDLYRQYTLKKSKQYTLSLGGSGTLKWTEDGFTLTASASLEYEVFVKASVTFTGTRLGEWEEIGSCPCPVTLYQPFDDEALRDMAIGGCYASGCQRAVKSSHLGRIEKQPF